MALWLFISCHMLRLLSTCVIGSPYGFGTATLYEAMAPLGDPPELERPPKLFPTQSIVKWPGLFIWQPGGVGGRSMDSKGRALVCLFSTLHPLSTPIRTLQMVR